MNSLGSVGWWEWRGMEAVWGRYGSCRGGPSHELYRRTNQTAIRQTLSKNGFSPTTLPQRPSFFAAGPVPCTVLVRLARLKNGARNARRATPAVPGQQLPKGIIFSTCFNVLIANRGPRLGQVSLPPFESHCEMTLTVDLNAGQHRSFSQRREGLPRFSRISTPTVTKIVTPTSPRGNICFG